MKWVHWGIIAIIVGVIWNLPVPSTIKPEGLHLLAIFSAVIYAVITKPLPMGAICMMALLSMLLTKILPFADTFSGFTSDIVWLIVFAFFISRGIIATGLGNRIAYTFMRLFGKKTLGLGYSMALTEFLLSPAIPSNTARAGGILYPILHSISAAFGSNPSTPELAKRVGSYLTLNAFHVTCVTGAMFLTAMSGNPLSADIAAQSGADLTWIKWAIAGIVPGFLNIAILPYLIYKLAPPTIKETPDAPVYARAKLLEMGKMSWREWTMAVVFVMLVVLWIFGESFQIKASVTALLGVAVLLLTGILKWKEIVKEENAWDTLIWFATLVMMASYLGKFGVTSWFGDYVAGHITGFTWQWGFLILSLIYFFSHYLFASLIAHIGAMYAAFLLVAIAIGTPVYLAAFVLAFFSNLFGALTHYSSGPAAVLFASGYVSIGTWWRVGSIVSLVNIVIWLGVGSLWWKFLGYW
ncbi:MAG: DASS family sodium-coupled anion symporter [Chlamydiota bacterium]